LDTPPSTGSERPCRCQKPGDSPEPPKPACHLEQPLSLAVCRTLTGYSVLVIRPELIDVLGLGADRCSGVARRHLPHHHGSAEPCSPAWGRAGRPMRVLGYAGGTTGWVMPTPASAEDRLVEYELSRRRLPGRAAADVKAHDDPSCGGAAGAPADRAAGSAAGESSGRSIIGGLLRSVRRRDASPPPPAGCFPVASNRRALRTGPLLSAPRLGAIKPALPSSGRTDARVPDRIGQQDPPPSCGRSLPRRGPLGDAGCTATITGKPGG
jgi:hypothetical protein